LLGHNPPVALSPSDWGLRGGALGNSAGFGLGEVSAALWLEAAWVKEVRALSAPAGFGTPFGLGRFKGSDADFSA
jgi:hypothetical protein